MKLGLITVLFGDLSFDKALDYVSESGIEMVEIGCGNYAGIAHCDPDDLLNSRKSLSKFNDTLKSRNIEISALACHGNPLHPRKDIAKQHAEAQRKAIVLAEKLGVDIITAFSGCPGDSEDSKYPNWVTCPWPPDYLDILKWQWEEKVIPFWKRESKFAGEHGVKIAFEMHPGFVVYNPESLLKLRNATGNNVGANFDPSHLFWQGIDPLLAIRELKDVIFHVHAKDTRIYGANASVNGVLDTKHYSDELNRSWIFRTVGYGHGYDFWRDFVSTLRMVGYDYVLSIEHEDSLLSVREGVRKAVDFLRQIILEEEVGEMWWA